MPLQTFLVSTGEVTLYQEWGGDRGGSFHRALCYILPSQFYDHIFSLSPTFPAEACIGVRGSIWGALVGR